MKLWRTLPVYPHFWFMQLSDNFYVLISKNKLHRAWLYRKISGYTQEQIEIDGHDIDVVLLYYHDYPSRKVAQINLVKTYVEWLWMEPVL
jgi:hypothetical protein